MRGRAWAAWGCLAASLLVVGAAVAIPSKPLEPVGALLFLVALVLFASLSGLWRRLAPPLPPMDDLGVRPGAGERWCAGCGRPAPRDRTCPSCGDAGRRARRKERRLQRKQRAGAQEKKT